MTQFFKALQRMHKDHINAVLGESTGIFLLEKVYSSHWDILNKLLEGGGECYGFVVGDALPLWLLRWTLGRGVWVRDLAWSLCCVLGHDTLLSRYLSPPSPPSIINWYRRHNISMQTLHTMLYTFLKGLIRWISLTIKSFFSWWSFPLFS